MRNNLANNIEVEEEEMLSARFRYEVWLFRATILRTYSTCMLLSVEFLRIRLCLYAILCVRIFWRSGVRRTTVLLRSQKMWFVAVLALVAAAAAGPDDK